MSLWQEVSDSRLWQRIRSLWGSARPVMAPAAQILDHSATSLAAALARAFSDWDDALGEPDVRVRRAAAGVLRAEEADAVGLEPRETLWRSLIPHLGGRIGEVAAGRLADALRDPDAEVRAAAAETLGGLRCAQEVQALCEAARDSVDSVRRNAVGALGRVGDGRIAPVLANALGDADAEVRAEAARALGSVAGHAAVVALSLAIRDVRAESRRRAARALVCIGSSTAVPVLTEALADRDPEVRYWCALALGQLRAPGTAHALAMALRAANDQACRLDVLGLRRMLIWALGETRSPVATPALHQALADPSPAIRTAAADALDRLPNAQAAAS